MYEPLEAYNLKNQGTEGHCKDVTLHDVTATRALTSQKSLVVRKRTKASRNNYQARHSRY